MPVKKTVIDIESGGQDFTHTSHVVVPCIYFELSHLGKKWQFTILSLSVFFFYLLYGITLEKIFLMPGLKKEGFYLTLVQFVFYTLLARFDMWLIGEKRHIPWRTYFVLAAATFATMGLSNASIGYLNYPTQVVFKSCKLIPVLIGGILIQKKVFSMIDFLAAAMMCIGLIFFTLADSRVSPNFDVIGVFMLSVALIADAVVSNVQEKAMKKYRATNAEVILYSYGLGLVYLLIFLLATGDLVSGYEAFSRDPASSYGYAFVFSLTGYFGMQVILSLVRAFGAFTAVTVTSMRKALSVVISFVLFSKPFTLQYFLGGMIVLAGIYMNLASKNKIDVFAKLHTAFRTVVSFTRLRRQC